MKDLSNQFRGLFVCSLISIRKHFNMHCEERSCAPKPSADTQVFSDFLMWFFIKCQRPALKLATDHKRTQLHNDMVAVAVLYVFVCVCE